MSEMVIGVFTHGWAYDQEGVERFERKPRSIVHCRSRGMTSSYDLARYRTVIVFLGVLFIHYLI